MIVETTFAIILGDRDFGDYELFCKEVDYALSRSTKVNLQVPLLHGSGAEKLAMLYGKEKNHQVVTYEKSSGESNADVLRKIIGLIRKRNAIKIGAMIFGSSEEMVQLAEIFREENIRCKLI